ncbi:DUF4012 domain-containing protein [Bifidobacterium simiiventris]|uniref:DUF4012 domain-containing protein n=1 Tax=Bifidobacterium simiiventris TaxID=2834434 RepID=UPI001C595FFC|nr:DUF4012 domain-containing protein [Bifidobacterium simiiventris]MBW3079542.1 DUF4012 domain-containing protein [Bifidobacterium simiiventris]
MPEQPEEPGQQPQKFDFSYMTDDSAQHGTQAGVAGPVAQNDALSMMTAEDANGETYQPHKHRRRRMSAQHIRRIKRRRMIRRILVGLLLVLLLIAGLCAWFGYSALKAKNEMQQAVSVASGMQSALKGGDNAALKTKMTDFSGHVNAAYRQTSSPLWSVASVVPYYGSDIKAVRTAVTAMENIASQGIPALQEASGALDLSNVTVSDGTIDLSSLTQAAQPLQTADTVIQNASRSIAAAPEVHISLISDALGKATSYLDTLSTLVHNVNVAAQVAPKMLANDGSTRTYLVLAQTNSEVRPSGGLPGSWGVMTVTNGKVEMGEFTAARDFPDFDEPVTELTAEERSLFTSKLGTVPQDVNFTPDFPRTGEIAQAMWQKAYGTKVDGVIAIDPVFLQKTLAVSGSVTLEDGVTLDGNNTAQYLLNQVYIDKPLDQQDAYFAAAAQAAFQHIMSNAKDGKSFLNAMTSSISSGHLKVWSARADEQKQIATTPIAGVLKTAAATPEVGVFYSDISQAKMDWYLKRSVSVEPDGVAANGANQYTVHIKFTNMLTADEVGALPQYIVGPFLDDIQAGQIRTAVFMYAPAGGRLVDWTMSDGSDIGGVTVHNGLTVGVKTMTLDPGQSYGITLHVQSAPGVDAPLEINQTPQIDGRTDQE